MEDSSEYDEALAESYTYSEHGSGNHHDGRGKHHPPRPSDDFVLDLDFDFNTVSED